MASSDLERKRKEPEPEAKVGSEEAAAGDEEESWVGPHPGEAAQAKKRKGNKRRGVFTCLLLPWGAARETSVALPGPGPEDRG